MVDKAQRRIQEAMKVLVDDIDRTYLRGMQKSMHLCSVECCEKKENSVDQVHRCIEGCSSPLLQAETFVQNELSQFQERLQRCVMVCQDRVRDQVTAETAESQDMGISDLPQARVSVYKAEFEGCAMQCVDDYIQLMPSVKKRIANILAKHS